MRSKSSMPSAEVSTGSERRSRIAVMKSDQMTSGRRNQVMPGARMLMMVVMYLIEPMSEEMPSTIWLMHHRCCPQVTPVETGTAESAAYEVQPTAAGPPST